MSDLVAFLLAGIAEDETETREALGDDENQRWATEDAGDLNEGFIVSLLRERLMALTALRAVVALHSVDHACPDSSGMDDYAWVNALCGADCVTLRLLAQLYADRAGYRVEWRPRR